jgi:hypothetical protein
MPVSSSAPWYFLEWQSALQNLMADWNAERAAGVVVTALGREVEEMLDYTLHSSSMTLLEGDPRTGKSFSARAWCERHPGQARFIEVPTGNDDTGFFRELARGLGIGNFLQYKAIEIRERVESVILTRDILLCLDEAHRLWPETNPRYSFPKRVNWLMRMANAGVPICLVATPQFIERQKAMEQKSGWNSAQFLGRLAHYKRLPVELELEDLKAVAKAVLPEADNEILRVLAAYARKSARYLAAIDSIAKRARYVANRAGRPEATTADVRKAMQESVIPSDALLVRTLEKNKPASGRAKMIPPPVMPEMPARAVTPDERSMSPDFPRRGGDLKAVEETCHAH